MFWRRWFRAKKKISFESPYGPMTAEKTELAKKEESTRDLTADENELKAAYVAAAEALTGGVAVGAELDADTLDELLKRVAPPLGPDGVEETAETFGFAFGEYLARRYKMRWLVLSDQYGTDFAVREPSTRCTVFPIDVVAKRLQSGERDFMGPIAFAIQREIGQLKSEQAGRG